MLAIRLQRLGRKAYPVYRLAVQESQRHPSSGRVVAYVGSYNPHTKQVSVNVEVAQKYLDNGAQPSPRVVKLLKEAGVKLPKWVKEFDPTKTKTIRNSDKLRKNQPKDEPVVEEEVAEAPVDEPTAEVEVEAPAEETAE
ncbi:MAG: 30S ribosomal protein S16 [Candidatus Saccharimonas sp.]